MVQNPIDEHGWLTYEALADLRCQITLGSIYYSDYENDYCIDSHQVYNFFESYISYCYEIKEELGDEYDQVTDGLLEEWYGSFEENPFDLTNLKLYLSDTLERFVTVLDRLAEKYGNHITHWKLDKRPDQPDNVTYWFFDGFDDTEIRLNYYDFEQFVQDLYAYCDTCPTEFIDELNEIVNKDFSTPKTTK